MGIFFYDAYAYVLQNGTVQLYKKLLSLNSMQI